MFFKTYFIKVIKKPKNCKKTNTIIPMRIPKKGITKTENKTLPKNAPAVSYA
jgi:hypothetical protein